METSEFLTRENNSVLLRKQTQKKLEKMGLDPVPKPSKALNIPYDVTQIDDRQLGRFHYLAVQWETYAGDALAMARVQETFAEYTYDVVLAKTIRNLEGGIQQKKSDAIVSKKVRIAKKQLLKATAEVIAFESQFNRFVRTAQALSREQTRREKLRGD